MALWLPLSLRSYIGRDVRLHGFWNLNPQLKDWLATQRNGERHAASAGHSTLGGTAVPAASTFELRGHAGNMRALQCGPTGSLGAGLSKPVGTELTKITCVVASYRGMPSSMLYTTFSLKARSRSSTGGDVGCR